MVSATCYLPLSDNMGIGKELGTRHRAGIGASAATDALESIQQLSELHERNITVLPKSRRSIDHLRRLFDYLEQHPIIDIKRTASALNVSYNTIASAVLKLTSLGILHETTNAARNRVFAYREYLNILRKDT